MIIYQTTNLINGKKYIGRDAWNRPNYLGGGRALKNAIKKYGKENFKKEILEYCNSKEELLDREAYWLKFYNVVEDPNFYNMTLSSKGWEKGMSRPELIGRKHSEETRLKLRDSHKGKKQTKQTIEKRVSKLIGKKRNEEQKQNLSKRKTKSLFIYWIFKSRIFLKKRF